MKYIFTSAILLLLPLFLFAQKNTVYFDAQWHTTDKEHASYYRHYLRANGAYQVKYYYLSGKLQMMGSFLSLDSPMIKDGDFIYFDSVGNPTSAGSYVNDKRNGQWASFYQHTSKMRSKSMYKNDELNGHAYRFDSLYNSVTAEGDYLNDKPVGCWNFYHVGNPHPYLAKMYNRSGDTVSVIMYDRLGNLQTIGQEVAGKSEGLFKTFRTDEAGKIDSNKVEAENFMSNGRQEGEQNYYYSNGKLMRKEHFEKGKMLSCNCQSISGTDIPCTEARDTTFFDNDGNIVTDMSADYYLMMYVRDLTYRIEERYWLRNKLKATGSCSTVFPEVVKDGHFTAYDTKGHITYEGDYKNDKKEGQWKYYFPHTDTLKRSITYANDEMRGEIKTYYSNGTLKREENYINEVTETGKCYAPDGRPIDFYPYMVMPVCGVDAGQFLAQNLHYPDDDRENNVQGRVVLSFNVNEDGSLTDIVVRQSVSKTIDSEAIRVLKLMPKWSPGTEDGVPVKVSYNLPLSFELEQ